MTRAWVSGSSKHGGGADLEADVGNDYHVYVRPAQTPYVLRDWKEVLHVNYAVHYAGLGKTNGARNERVTTVISWDDKHGPVEKTLSREASQQREEFITRLNPRDIVFIPSGGGAHYFTLACHITGATVMCLPTCRLPKIYQEQGDKVKMSAALIRQVALENPQLFHRYTPIDGIIARTGYLGRLYKAIQKVRKAAIQRIEAPVRGIEILGDICATEAEFAIYMQVITASDLFDLDLTDDNELNKKIKQSVKMLKGMEPTMVLSRIFSQVEKRILNQVQKYFRKLPLWYDYLDHIPGVGPSIGSRVFGEIGDIRRFPTPAHLVSYAGYGFDENGRRVRARTGQVANWSWQLKQAVFDFVSYISTKASTSNPWKRAFVTRLEYEKSIQEERFDCLSVGERSYPFLRAQGWLAQKFLRHVHRTWHRYLEGLPYQPYDFECLRGEEIAKDEGQAVA